MIRQSLYRYNKTPLKIVYIHPININYIGGGEKFIIEVLTRLQKRGHKVSLINTGWAPRFITLSHAKSVNFDIYYCRYVKSYRNSTIIEPSCLLSYARDNDLIYFSAVPPVEILLNIFKRMRVLKLPMIAVFHSSLKPHDYVLDKLYVPIYVSLYKSFDRLHVLNQYMYDFFVKYYKVNVKKVELIPNGVDTKYFRLIRNFENGKEFIVLFVSRLVKEKGVDILAEVIKCVNNKNMYKNIVFRIVGAGPLTHIIKDLEKRYSNVEYLGYISKDELVKEFNRAHVFLFPSKIEYLPLVLLEASACGLPIVGSAIPGVVDVIKTIGYGILVRLRDIEGYVRGILYFYSVWSKDPEKYYEIRLSIRRRTVANYDWDIIIDRIENMFRQVLAEYAKVYRFHLR